MEDGSDDRWPPPLDKNPSVEALLEKWARERGSTRDGTRCAQCGSLSVAREDFKDDLSRKEFGISRLCQKCQDEIFMEV